MSLLSVPWTPRLVAACLPDGLFSPGERRPQFAPTKLALVHLWAITWPPVRRRRRTLPNDKTPHDPASIEDILTRSSLPNASSAPPHPNSPLAHPCEIVDSSSSRRTILKPLHPLSLNDHGYRLHQRCCPACWALLPGHQDANGNLLLGPDSF